MKSLPGPTPQSRRSSRPGERSRHQRHKASASELKQGRGPTRPTHSRSCPSGLRPAAVPRPALSACAHQPGCARTHPCAVEGPHSQLSWGWGSEGSHHTLRCTPRLQGGGRSLSTRCAPAGPRDNHALTPAIPPLLPRAQGSQTSISSVPLDLSPIIPNPRRQQAFTSPTHQPQADATRARGLSHDPPNGPSL